MSAVDEARGRVVHAAWRDVMLRQGREVAPERMSWDTLSQQDKELDAAIEAAVRAEYEPAARLAMETIGWTQGFLVDEPNVYETWFRGVDPAMSALRAALKQKP